MHRSKPYQRPRSDPDAPGAWKHDLHPSSSPSSSSLASRISNGPGKAPSLLSRISHSGSQKGRELLGTPSASSPKLHGYAPALPVSTTNPNAGLELFPASGRGGDGGVRDKSFDQRAPGQAAGKPMPRSVYSSGLVAAGLGAAAEQERRERRAIQKQNQQQASGQAVSILGQGRIWVRVENLAPGTTAEDVQSAFAPSPIISARQAPSSSDLVSIELEYTDRPAAEELIRTYNGVVADGNTLKVSIVPPKSQSKGGLASRMTGGPATQVMGVEEAKRPAGGLGSRIGGGNRVAAVGNGIGGSSAGKELFDGPSSSKLYSDSILRSNPSSGVITLAGSSSSAYGHDTGAAYRQDAWARNGSLAQRVGGRGGGMMIE